MLGPVHCGPFTGAPLLPKLRGCFAEFLNNASPAGLRVLPPSTCVGLRYGCRRRHSGFSRHRGAGASLLSFGPRHGSALPGGFSSPAAPPLVPVFSLPAHPSPMRPRSSGRLQYRNLHLLPIGYASRPRLRTRLTQGRSALPWKPRIFGRKDSHLPLATHSGILSRVQSTAPHGAASPRTRCSPTGGRKNGRPRASAVCFSPGHFRRRASRLVSYYALFECMAASEPTS